MKYRNNKSKNCENKIKYEALVEGPSIEKNRNHLCYVHLYTHMNVDQNKKTEN